MIRTDNRLTSQVKSFLACSFVLAAISSPATAETFALISSASSITAVPSFGGTIGGSQLPGSLTAHLQGTLEATLSPGSIEFPGGSTLDFISQPGPFFPGAAPADFAASTSLVFAVLRDGIMDMIGGPRDIFGGINFSAQGDFEFTSGLIDVLVLGSPSSLNLSGLSFHSDPDPAGTITAIGSEFEIYLPVDGVFTDGDLMIHFTGQIVGRTGVPELGSLSLACVGTLLMGFTWWRRRTCAVTG